MEEKINLILKTLNDFREENNQRWEENERRWKENDKRLEEIEKHLKEIDIKLKELEKRIIDLENKRKQDFKDITKIFERYEDSVTKQLLEQRLDTIELIDKHEQYVDAKYKNLKKAM